MKKQNIDFLTDDFNVACNKLAQYYLQEFTEISLYSPNRIEDKVPLERLYVAMKWIKCNKQKISAGSKCKEPQATVEESDMHCDYTQIFDKVCFESLY